IGVDHAIEHVNRMMKVKGGLSGITLKPAASAKFFLTAPEMTRLSEEVMDMAKASTQRISEALPGFHTFTGSDTTGKFAGKGKIKCWNTLKTASVNVITALCQLGKTIELSEDVFIALEEFVCRLYYPRSNIVSIATIRWQLFQNSQGEAEKLPTQAALRNHILRAHYQALIWSNDTTACPALPSPLGYDWTLGSSYSAVTSLLPPASSAVVELVKCGCTTSRCGTSSCSCRKRGLACTDQCVCASDTEAFDNETSDSVILDEESDDDDDDCECDFVVHDNDDDLVE
ncbi:hypothetical protein ScPMuIL_006505, partial [Solemya velum]